MEFYSVIKKNKTTSMVTQTQKDKHCMFPLMCGSSRWIFRFVCLIKGPIKPRKLEKAHLSGGGGKQTQGRGNITRVIM